MGMVVDRRPAHIHAHMGRIERAKNPLLARQRIVELQFHRCVTSRVQTPSACWPGMSQISKRRKDGRSQRLPLANNLAANDAADGGWAEHDRTMVEDGHGVKSLARR